MSSSTKNTKVYEQVIDQIKDMIINGTLKAGDKLSSERELAEQLQVSRTSIREALKALQIIGLIQCKQGGGNYISEDLENGLFEPLSIMFMLKDSNPEEIIEVRRVIEVQTAAIAAQKITDKELEDLEILIKAFKNSKDENDNVQIDKRFHYEIAKASKNFIIVNILNAISSLIDSFIKDARKKIIVDEGNMEVLADQHEDIYIALKNHNPKKASEAMKKHLEFANKYIMMK